MSTDKRGVHSRDLTRPEHRASIVTNYLSTQSDLDDVVAMARLIGRMQETTAIKNILASAPERDLPNMSDDDLISDFRLRSGTVYHPAELAAWERCSDISR